MNKLISVAIFAAGAVTGSAVTWYVLKEKYARIAQEEIDSVKAMYKHKKENDEPNDILESEEAEEPEEQYSEEEVSAYKNLAKTYNYTQRSKVEEEEDDDMDEPYVIRPEEFGDYIDYEQISLTYFADGVLADEDTLDPIDDVAGLVGPYFYDHFGEYEDDSVFVRNDRLRCEYEILKDERNYKDVASKKYSQVANQVFD